MISAFMLIALLADPLQPPIQSGGNKEQKPQPQQTQPAQTQTAPSHRGTEADPIIVRPIRSQDQAEEDRADRLDEQASRRQAFWLSVVTLIVLGFQVLLLINQNRIINSQSAIMDTQAKHMADGLEETRRSITIAERNTKSAEDAVTLAHIEQRAWLVPLRVEFLKPTVGQPLKCHVYITNTGRTPAKKCIGWLRLRSLHPNEPFVFEKAPRQGVEGISVIAPGETATRLYVVTEKHLDEKDLPIIVSRELILHVYGEMTYEDVFGKTHWMRCHYIYEPESEAVAHGTEGNDCD